MIEPMKISIPKGTYIVAVSGGVDSVVLLDLLSKQKDLQLVVAHFDHGIRSDSAKDREFTQELARKYVVPFEFAEGKLGKNASEEKARNARYAFLEEIKTKYNASAIVTAHHQDDVLETIMLNILRGTGRKGLSSLQSGKSLLRPLLHISKDEIREYAKKSQLTWHEDETNQDMKYMRNWVRLTVVPKLTQAQREQLVALYKKSKSTNDSIDTSLHNMMDESEGSVTINTKMFGQLSHALARELCASWLRRNGIADFDSRTIERLTVGMKTLTTGKTLNVKNGFDVVRDGDSFCLRSNIR